MLAAEPPHSSGDAALEAENGPWYRGLTSYHWFVLGVAADQKELTGFARDFQAGTSNSTPLIVAAVTYLIITLPLTQVVAWLERRQRRSR